MATLRSPDGCPWDREQTHDSIKSHLIEEAFEVIDALEGGDTDEFREELGDLLLQVVFHARLAEEAGNFNIDDVVAEISQKLIRRHPHIFGDVELQTADEVVNQWEEIKATEKERDSYLAGVPVSMPALAMAQKLQQKAARVGFDWPDQEGIFEKLAEEIAEFKETQPGTKEQVDEFGDILFTLVNHGRYLGIDTELALRRVNHKFRRRFAAMEAKARQQGQDFPALTLEEKDSLWNQIKEEIDDDD